MRGFITIATGSEYYYKLARQLLRSARCVCKERIPFAIICDCENEFTSEFDKVILMDQPHRSYLDKLLMYQYSPFEETIFIDADSLILSDPTALWDDFSKASPVSCYGKLYPIGAKDGWFQHENAGRWKDKIKHQIDLHGGIYYFRKTIESQRVFDTAVQLIPEYDKYNFKGFSKPADEPLIAFSMAIHDCVPVEKNGQIIFAHSLYKRLSVAKNGDLLLDRTPCNTIVLHFATKNTYCFMYQYMSEIVNRKYLKNSNICALNSWDIRKKTLKYDIKTWFKYSTKRILRHVLPSGRMKRALPQ